MKTKLIAAAVLSVAFAAPALAQEFYIVREGDSGPCRIVETRPSGGTVVILGNRMFSTRIEAERELTVVCRDDDKDD
jgi:hypothetical protein